MINPAFDYFDFFFLQGRATRDELVLKNNGRIAATANVAVLAAAGSGFRVDGGVRHVEVPPQHTRRLHFQFEPQEAKLYQGEVSSKPCLAVA